MVEVSSSKDQDLVQIHHRTDSLTVILDQRHTAVCVCVCVCVCACARRANTLQLPPHLSPVPCSSPIDHEHE